MSQADPLEGLRTLSKFLDTKFALKPTSVSSLQSCITRLSASKQRGEVPTAAHQYEALEVLFRAITTLASVLVQHLSTPQPTALLQAAVDSAQLKEFKESLEACRAMKADHEASRAQANAAHSQLQQQLSELAQEKEQREQETEQQLTKWTEVVSKGAVRAAKVAARQTERDLRIVQAFPAELTAAKAGQTATAVLEGLSVPAGAILRVSPEYPGRDRKRAPQALVVTVTALAFDTVFAAEQRQKLKSLTASGTRVCRHLSGLEHACRKALYTRYSEQHTAAAPEAGPAEGRHRLPPHRFNESYTVVTFNPNRDNEVVLRLTKEEVESINSKSGKAPPRTQAA